MADMGMRKPGIVVVSVMEGRNLKAMDLNGFSDPYVECRLQVKPKKKLTKRTTAVMDETLDPVWNETFFFCEKGMQACREMQLTVKCFDKDGGTNFDDFIGSCMIDLAHVEPEKDDAHHGLVFDGWRTLSDKKNRPGAKQLGELRLRVECTFGDSQWTKAKLTELQTQARARRSKRLLKRMCSKAKVFTDEHGNLVAHEDIAPRQKKSAKWCAQCHRPTGLLARKQCKSCTSLEWTCVEPGSIHDEAVAAHRAKALESDKAGGRARAPIMCGYLRKKQSSGEKWQERWFEMDPRGFTIAWYSDITTRLLDAKSVLKLEPSCSVEESAAKWCQACGAPSTERKQKSCAKCMSKKWTTTVTPEVLAANAMMVFQRGPQAPKGLFYFTLHSPCKRDLHLAAMYEADRAHWEEALRRAIAVAPDLKQIALQAKTSNSHHQIGAICPSNFKRIGDCKWCVGCGMGTKKPERELCKSCHGIIWTTCKPDNARSARAAIAGPSVFKVATGMSVKDLATGGRKKSPKRVARTRRASIKLAAVKLTAGQGRANAKGAAGQTETDGHLRNHEPSAPGGRSRKWCADCGASTTNLSLPACKECDGWAWVADDPHPEVRAEASAVAVATADPKSPTADRSAAMAASADGPMQKQKKSDKPTQEQKENGGGGGCCCCCFASKKRSTVTEQDPEDDPWRVGKAGRRQVGRQQTAPNMER